MHIIAVCIKLFSIKKQHDIQKKKQFVQLSKDHKSDIHHILMPLTSAMQTVYAVKNIGYIYFTQKK